MFEISWSELLILGVVILLFVKPKDLPYFFNTLGRFFGDLKRQANEFRRQFEDAMREAEMENIRKELGEVRDQVSEAIDEMGTLAEQGQHQLGKLSPELQKNPSASHTNVEPKQEASLSTSSSESKGPQKRDEQR